MSLPSTADLIEKAKALGFTHAALVNLDEVQLDDKPLMEWLGKGFHGNMDWMANNVDKRTTPGALMSNTQSILCVTLNYYPGPIQTRSGLKIARYAQGTDYHRVLKRKLKTLLEWLQSLDPTIQGRPLTDSAPMLEKPLAVQAGLGWQGKHTNLISRDTGSWLFIAELLLNKRFDDAPPPTAHMDFCGSCRRCIDACPTEAIVEPYVLDATKCISYWTIEQREGTFPQPIAHNLQGWMFGCDICQEVCPWNLKFQQPTTESAFEPRPWNKEPMPEDFETLTPERFKVRYRQSPIKRTGMAAIQRNALLAQASLSAGANSPS